MALSRADKPSPHSSPRLSRRSITSVPSTQSQNDIYSGHQQQQQHNHPIQIATTASTSMHSINGNTVTPSTNHNNNKIETNNKTCMAQQVILNRMSAPMLPSSSSTVLTQSAAMTKVLNKAFSADTAPPLPPRKSSPGVDNLNRCSKSAQIIAANPNSVSSASSLVNLVNPSNVSASHLSRSSENITCCDFDVPKCNPPPIPKHQNQNHNKPALVTPIECISSSPPSNEDNTLEDDKIIVGPAETISGIIDTRPIEARKPIIIDNEKSNSNNVYHMKSATNQQNHIRHQSFPTNNSSVNNRTTPSKSVTIQNFGVQEITGEPETTNSSGSMIGDSSSNPLLYENVTIAKRDCKEPYENVNLEYTARLMSEGYSQDNVRLALGISRNNIEMACDILHGFVSKSGA